MKIEGPGRPASAGRAEKKADRKVGGSGDFASRLEEASESGHPEAVTPVRGVDSLLALQEVEDSTSNHARARQRAERLMDHLRGIQLDLLDGRVSRNRLEEIQSTVQERRESSDDPRLDALLNDIETRAAVELAKYRRDD